YQYQCAETAVLTGGVLGCAANCILHNSFYRTHSAPKRRRMCVFCFFQNIKEFYLVSKNTTIASPSRYGIRWS
ncbi:MAG: hypothetical protein RSC36_06110, partial [Ruthenibacterium sp.]